MDNFTFNLDWYHKELERQNLLNESVNIPTGILTGIFAFYAFLVNQFNYEEGYSNLNCFFFMILLCFSFLCWILSLIYVSKSYNNHFSGYEYSYLPLATFLNDNYNEIVNYVDTYGDRLPTGIDADSIYERNVLDILQQSIDINSTNNLKKTGYLFVAKRWLLGSIICLILAMIPFGINFVRFNKLNKIQDIKISNISELDSILNKNNKLYYGKRKDTTTAATKAAAGKVNKGRTPTSGNKRHNCQEKIGK